MASVDQTGKTITSAERVATHLRLRGARFSRIRRGLVEGVVEAGRPLTPTELMAAVKLSAPVSTLYRNLAQLEAWGVLLRSTDRRGVARYELAEWLAGHHHHVTCVECGRSEDVEVSAAGERSLRAAARAVARRAGFAVVDHHLEVEGRCSRCR